jgi:hypothetical protein
MTESRNVEADGENLKSSDAVQNVDSRYVKVKTRRIRNRCNLLNLGNSKVEEGGKLPGRCKKFAKRRRMSSAGGDRDEEGGRTPTA